MANPKALSQPPSHYPSQQEAKAPVAAPTFSQKHHFYIDWTAPNGMRFEGDFICRIPTMRDQWLIDDKRIEIAAQCKMRQDDKVAMAVLDTYALLSVVLEESPDWLRDPTEVIFPDLLVLVSQEVTSFIERFHQPAKPTAAGEGATP